GDQCQHDGAQAYLAAPDARAGRAAVLDVLAGAGSIQAHHVLLALKSVNVLRIGACRCARRAAAAAPLAGRLLTWKYKCLMPKWKSGFSRGCSHFCPPGLWISRLRCGPVYAVRIEHG